MSKPVFRESGLPQGHSTKTVKGNNTITPASGKAFYITSVVNSNASSARTLTYKSDASTTHTLDVGGASSVNPSYPIYAVSIAITETDLAVTYIEA